MLEKGGQGHGRPGGLPDAYAFAGRACRVVNPSPTQACSGTTRGRGGREENPPAGRRHACGAVTSSGHFARRDDALANAYRGIGMPQGVARGRGQRRLGEMQGPARWLVQPCRLPGCLRSSQRQVSRRAHSGAGEGNPVQPLIPLPVLVALVSRGLLAEALRVDEDEEDEG